MFTFLPGALGHGPGGEPITSAGSFALGPVGSDGSSAQVVLSSLGSVEAGDVLRYFWEANEGLGPPVLFQILRLRTGVPTESEYEVTAASRTGDWTLSSVAEYAASWSNPNGEAVNVNYLLSLLPPVVPAAFDWTPLILVGVAGALVAFLLFWSLRGRPEANEPSEETEEPESPRP